MNGVTFPLLSLLSTVVVAGAWAQQSPADGPPPVRAVFAIIDSAGTRAGQVNAVQNPDGVLSQQACTSILGESSTGRGTLQGPTPATCPT